MVRIQAGLACSEVMRQVVQSKEQTGRKREGLKCVYFNARSIRKKVDEHKA